MFVCVKPDYFRSHVKEGLRDLFSSRTLPDGRRGVFHPDNFTFGQPVYLSSLYAAAQSVDANTMTLQYFEALKSLGDSPATKFVVPLELAGLLRGVTGSVGQSLTNGHAMAGSEPVVGNESGGGS